MVPVKNDWIYATQNIYRPCYIKHQQFFILKFTVTIFPFFQFCIFLLLSFTYFPVVLICKVHIIPFFSLWQELVNFGANSNFTFIKITGIVLQLLYSLICTYVHQGSCDHLKARWVL